MLQLQLKRRSGSSWAVAAVTGGAMNMTGMQRERNLISGESKRERERDEK